MPNITVPCQYRTGRTLSTGTYGTLKEAIHIKTRTYYACKVINKEAMRGREDLVRNEISVLKRIQSGNPNIVKLHDYFETSHSVYLCLDLCTGGTLFDRICNEGTYSEAKTVDLVRTILIAVKHIHDVGVEHRAINPKALHFRSPAEGAPIMIMDFGVSRMTEDTREGPDDGRLQVPGLHRYMAPEVVLQLNHSKPVDVWGVGLLAFFMIAGCTPFDRDFVQDETDAVAAGQYEFAPKDKWGKISTNARDFIGMCLTADVDRRPTAGEALAHTWLIPATPRSVVGKSRAASLMELRLPYFKRVFNPKRKWRIVMLTIKALNRMHTLAGHALPSTQQDTEESADLSTIDPAYFLSRLNIGLAEPDRSQAASEDQASSSRPLGEEGITAFPSPVSSVCSFDDQESWLTRASMSTEGTDDDAQISTHNRDDSDPPSPQSFFSFPASDTRPSGNPGKPPSQETAHVDSTASSVYSPGVQEDTETEGPSPPSANASQISTFVIYTPKNLSENRVAVRPEDVQTLENSFEEGGIAISVHRPTGVEAWIEDHYDDPLLESARAAGLSGPIPAMLSPDVPALAIFGSILDDTILSIAKTLAEVSGFSVMVRPIADDPFARFMRLNVEEESLAGTARYTDLKSGAEKGRDGEGEGERDDVEFDGGRKYSVGPALRLRGGMGDDSDEDESNLPWDSKPHKATVWLNLWPDEEHEYSLSIRTRTVFRVQPEVPEGKPMESQSEVIGRVDLKVEAKPTVLPDRSYTSLGFLAHRQHSVIDREFIDCGFDRPDQTLKSIDLKSTQLTATANVGGMNLHPAGGVSGAYSKTRSKTVELADNKPTPRCDIFHEPGDRWNRDGKSYISYDITTVPREDPRTQIKHPLHAPFAMGINMDNSENTGLPKMSFVTRNQVIIWIWDPTLKPKVRGLLVLMTSYIPNIRTRQPLVVQEDLDVHFATNTAQNNKVDAPAKVNTTAVSLSIAPIQGDNSRKNALSELFTDVRRKLAGPQVPTLANLPLKEYISRGWDATNQKWRSALWTSLDKDFHNIDLGPVATSPVWKLGWNPADPEEIELDDWVEVDEDQDQGQGQNHDVVDGNPFETNKGKGKERDLGGADTEPIAGPSTNVDTD